MPSVSPRHTPTIEPDPRRPHHCIPNAPDARHVHDLATVVGARRTFETPDHEAPSFVEAVLTVDPSGSAAAVQTQPIIYRLVDLEVVTVPAGLEAAFDSPPNPSSNCSWALMRGSLGGLYATAVDATFVDDSVTAGVTYTYAVRAVDAAGNISWRSNLATWTAP
jgi:hypothetical protein